MVKTMNNETKVGDVPNVAWEEKMSEIKIYNQEMYVRMTDLPAEVHRWCHRLVGATEEHMFWKSGAYNFWTINDRKDFA